MIDPFGRTITYLRVSVTDRCDFRCVYCMAEEMSFLPKSELLTLEELDRVCSAFIRLGVRKLRLTGGEPLVRRNIMTLFRSLGRHLETGALDELTLTTNGSQLARYADELRDCGVRRVNVSVDTLDPAKFTEITRRGRLDAVLEGLGGSKGGRARGQDQHGGVARGQRGRARRSRRVDRRRGLRSRVYRGHADGRYRRREPARPISAAVAGARPAAAALDARRDRLPHRRPGALCRRCAKPAGGSASSRR